MSERAPEFVRGAFLANQTGIDLLGDDDLVMH
jgi:hypothetical protein